MTTDQIKYYRGVLYNIVDGIKNDEEISIEWETTTSNKFSIMLSSSKYSEKVRYNLIEARMQLGNSLQFREENKNPYREASIRRMTGEDDHIPDPVDVDVNFQIPPFDTKVEKIDYIREILEEMKENLYNTLKRIRNDKYKLHIEDAINKISLARNYCGKILYCIKKLKEIDAREAPKA